MELKQIQDLIKLFGKSNLSELKIEEGDFKLTLKGNSPFTQATPTTQPTTIYTQAPPVPAIPQPIAESTKAEGTGANKNEAEEAKHNGYITVNSPMIGTFYRASGPDKPPFIKVGDMVDEGNVLCVIEAMKLFNEIESEVSGKVVKVLVEDASPVEYDQPLFLIDPS